MPKTSFADQMADWEQLLAKVDANQGDLLNLEGFRAQLVVEMAGAKEANFRQATLQAETQQATRDLEGFLARGNDLAVRIRNGIRSRYGNRSEKLTEFGLQPLRKRKTAKEKQPPEGEKPAPSKTTSDVESK